MIRHPAATLAIVLTVLSGAAPAHAQDRVGDFYAGKQLSFIVGAGPGGGYDLQARVVARHLGRHIPGNPTVIVQNIPSRIAAANNMFSTVAKDGTVIALLQRGVLLARLIYPSGVRYDIEKFHWLGSLNSETAVSLAWHTAPVKTIEDAFKIESKLSGTGVGSTVSIYPTVMNNVLGTKFKLIMGYKGSNDAQLAVERGEVDGHSTSWTAVKVAHPDWRPQKKINVVVQFSVKRHPEMADVPTVVELARNDEERKILSAVVNAAEIGTAFFTTPGAPPDRVEALRRAFDATMKDPEFLAEAERSQLTVGPLTGGDLQKVVAEVSGLTPELVEKVKAAYEMKK